MVKKPTISSLKELRERKLELRMDMELAKREFAHTVGTSRENIGSFLLKKVAAPVGGAGLALVALNKLLSSGSPREIVRETKVIHQYPDGRPYAGSEAPAARLAATQPVTRRQRKKMLSIATIASLAKVIIPLIQAIIGTVTAHKAQEHAKEAKHAAQKS